MPRSDADAVSARIGTRKRDAEWVAAFLLTVLRWAPAAMTREELVDRVLDHAVGAMGCHWKPSTAARRVRDALGILLDGTEPVINAGRGFKLAWRATQAERDRAADIVHKILESAAHKEKRIREARVPADAVQGELFEAVS